MNDLTIHSILQDEKNVNAMSKDKKTEIYQCAKALFEQKGYKDTNIAEIMKATGFATGTFYLYYASKDQLFMEIYNDENVKLKKKIEASVDMSAEPAAVIREMMAQNLQGMRENPILREWYNKDVFAKIEKCFRDMHGMDYVQFLYDDFLVLVRTWQKEGRMRKDIDAEMIMAIFTALINVDLHKEEIGLRFFPELMEHLEDFILKGLRSAEEGDSNADG